MSCNQVHEQFCDQTACPIALVGQSMNELAPEKLRQALNYVQDHLSEKISLEAIANNLDMSLYHFSRLFKQSMGVSPYHYVLLQRIEYAKQLLKQRNLTVTAIALECGFSSQNHLNKHFRKLVGMSPTAYRALLLNLDVKG